MTIIGRKVEIQELEKYYDTGNPELVIVYGRRRVGKTYLIREYFANDFAFYFTGSVGVSNSTNLRNFDTAIKKYGGELFDVRKVNLEGFDLDHRCVVINKEAECFT